MRSFLLTLALLAACQDPVPVPVPVPDGAAEASPTSAPTDEPDATGPTDGTVGPLDDDAYRFCHVPGADAADAREFCPLLEGVPEDQCPGLRKTCEGAEESVFDPAGCQGMIGGGPGSMPAAPPEPPAEPFKLDITPFQCDPPTGALGWLTAIAQWATALLVALIVLVVLRLVVRALGWNRPDRTEPDPTERVFEEVRPTEEIPDAPVEDLLAAAQSALDTGRWADAVLLARAASLRRLADAGRIRLHRSRTDREYLRTVRREAPLHEALGDVLREVEAERWGARSAGEEAARRVLGAARRILGFLAAAGLLVVLVGASSSWRYGPQGDAALYALFAERGYEVSWRLRGFSALDDDEDLDVLVIDLSGIRPSDTDWEAIRAWVSAGGLLVVAGDAEVGFPDLGVAAPLPADTGVRVADWLVPSLPSPRFPEGPTTGWQDGKGDPWASTGEDASTANSRLKNDPDTLSVAVALAPATTIVQSLYVDSGTVLAISDARLLWNGSLVAADNARFLGDLVKTGEDFEVWWFEPPVTVQLATSASAGSTNPIGALANARLLPLIVQLFGLVVLGALWKGWPFGPLRDPPDEGRLQFADHVRAVGLGYARRRASRYALGAFASLWLARIGPAGMEQAARRGGRSKDEAQKLVEAARAAAESRDGPSKKGDLDVMEDLWRITKRS